MSAPTVDRLDQDAAEFAPAPLPPAWITDGAPAPRMARVSRPERSGLSVGVWECEAGAFHYTYADDETITIVHGRVRITDEHGHVTVLAAGDVATMRAGTTVHWQLLEPLRKVFVLQEVRSPASRVLRKATVLVRQARRRRLLKPGLIAGGGSAAGLIAVAPW